MKHSKNIAIIATALITSMGSAFAQNHSYDPNNPVWQPNSAQHQKQAQKPNSNSHGEPQKQNHEQPNHQGQPNMQHPNQSQRPNQSRPQFSHDNEQPRGQFNNHQAHDQFAVGGKLPKDYRGKDHRVNYKTHGLPAPAKNQAWVEADGRYLLVNILTNAIVQVLLNN